MTPDGIVMEMKAVSEIGGGGGGNRNPWISSRFSLGMENEQAAVLILFVPHMSTSNRVGVGKERRILIGP